MQLAFGAIVFGAQAMSMTMGLGFAMAVDPQNGVQVPVVAQLYVILGTLLFLSVDGHLALIDAVVQSYSLIPIGSLSISASSLTALVSLGSIVFAGGILLALPVMTALLLINLAFGIITRTAPQLNIFAVGFPVTILAGLFIMFLVMPGFLVALTNIFQFASRASRFLDRRTDCAEEQLGRAKEQPTLTRRIAKERSVARPRELNMLFVMIASILFLWGLGGWMIEAGGN